MSEKRKQGRPSKFPEGKKSLALDLSKDQYGDLEDACEVVSQEIGRSVSKGMVLRAALDHWLDSSKPLLGELKNEQ